MSVVPLIKAPSKKEAQTIIRKLAEKDKISFHSHSKKRKRGRQITNLQILHCLKKGFVVEEPFQDLHHKGWNTAVKGHVTGKELRVAVCIRWKEDLLIITCYYD